MSHSKKKRTQTTVEVAIAEWKRSNNPAALEPLVKLYNSGEIDFVVPKDWSIN